MRWGLILALLILGFAIYAAMQLYDQYRAARDVEIVDVLVEVKGVELEESFQVKGNVYLVLTVILLNHGTEKLDVYVTRVQLYVSGVRVGEFKNEIHAYVPPGEERTFRVPVALPVEAVPVLIGALNKQLIESGEIPVEAKVEVQVPIRVLGYDVVRLPFTFTITTKL
ncbi:MAG: hypothetical protein DRO65_01525 [Candidatus Altiarchaeales archaeon]|nr:MAG: hypothetical protein DRO65_01525 [Candidatus Altiarchaeales archaeon]